MGIVFLALQRLGEYWSELGELRLLEAVVFALTA